MVPDNFLDDEAQEFLAEIRVQLRFFRQFAQARDLVVDAAVEDVPVASLHQVHEAVAIENPASGELLGEWGTGAGISGAD